MKIRDRVPPGVGPPKPPGWVGVQGQKLVNAGRKVDTNKPITFTRNDAEWGPLYSCWYTRQSDYADISGIIWAWELEAENDEDRALLAALALTRAP
jgi:hypothetical protein